MNHEIPGRICAGGVEYGFTGEIGPGGDEVELVSVRVAGSPSHEEGGEFGGFMRIILGVSAVYEGFPVVADGWVVKLSGRIGEDVACPGRVVHILIHRDDL